MVEFLISQGCDDEFDREEAIYWFASDWHSGQESYLYSALSTSLLNPSPISTGPEDRFWYDALKAEFIQDCEREG
jgi:hypothetical protein